jgi:hypothetical protein
MNKQNLFYLVFDNLNNLYKRLSVFLMEQQPQLLVNDYFFLRENSSLNVLLE